MNTEECLIIVWGYYHIVNVSVFKRRQVIDEDEHFAIVHPVFSLPAGVSLGMPLTSPSSADGGAAAGGIGGRATDGAVAAGRDPEHVCRV